MPVFDLPAACVNGTGRTPALLLVLLLSTSFSFVSAAGEGDPSPADLLCIPQSQTPGPFPGILQASSPAGADPKNIFSLRERISSPFMPVSGNARKFFSPPPASLGSLPSAGIIRVPVILVQLTDDSPYPGQTTTDVNRKFFGDGDPDLAPYESVSRYYQRSSYGQFILTGEVLGWAKLPYSRADIEKAAAWAESQYPGHGNDLARCGIVYQAAKYFADQGVDFSQYDNDANGVVDMVYIKFAGPEGGSGSIWETRQLNGGVAFQSYPVQGLRFNSFVFSPYSSVFESGNTYPLYSPVRDIYETGHALGLPDYADRDPSAGPKGGIGGLDMMDARVGDHNAFSKFLLGWLTPAAVTEGDREIDLTPSSLSPSALIVHPYRATAPQTEFFLVEYRIPGTGNIPPDVPVVSPDGTSFSGTTPLTTPGLVIWHVDAAYTPDLSSFRNDNSRTLVKLLRLMEADGREDLETSPGRYGGYFDQEDLYTTGIILGEHTVPDTRTNGGYGSGITIEPLSINETLARVRVVVQEPENPLPCLDSLVPAAVPTGSGPLSLSAHGSGFVRGSSILWNGAPREVTFLDPTSLLVQVPAADLATPGNVSIAVSNPPPGGGVSRSLDLLVTAIEEPVPVITGIDPSNATAGGAGLRLNVQGTGFSGTSTICWNGDPRSTERAGDGTLSTSIEPADIAFPGDAVITVQNGGVGGYVSNPLLFTVFAPPWPVPVVTGIQPSEVPAGGDDQVFTVTGSSFTPKSSVRWNGTDQLTIYVSSATLVVTVNRSLLAEPVIAEVTVFTPAPGGGVSNGVPVTVRSPDNPVPVITGLDPASAQAGSGPLLLQVTGTGFCPASRVLWNGAARETAMTDQTRLVASVPAGDLDTPGAVEVVVRNPAPGGGTSVPVEFRVNAPPTIVPTTTVPSTTVPPTPVPTLLPGELPVANFSAEPLSGPAPLTVAFTDRSSGTPGKWYWTFGDGSVSSEPNPVHNYTQAGTFPVSLKITGPGGSYKKTVSGCIHVSGSAPLPTPTTLPTVIPTSPPPTTLPTVTPTSVPTTLSPGPSTLVANFAPSTREGFSPLEVHFTDLSTGSPARWYWLFGDGAVSTEQSPAHLYTVPGTYPVTLRVWDPAGSYRKVWEGCITVRPPVSTS